MVVVGCGLTVVLVERLESEHVVDLVQR